MIARIWRGATEAEVVEMLDVGGVVSLLTVAADSPDCKVAG